MKRNKKIKRIACRSLAVLLSLCFLFPTMAFGAEGKKDGTLPVTYDEALYVTMDHYGNRRQLSVVKGVDLNGNQSFTDYGDYRSVQNMSGYDQPAVTAEGAVFHLKDYGKSRLYFEAVPSDPSAVALPWDFKVSYKLNGVPTKAENLAGKSGLVEIIAECEANPEVNDYLKNNMLLELVTLVDMDQILSVEAEGAQIQSLGKYKAVIFAALPGESTTFRIRIGTESFSSLGLIMMMEPGTLAQMEQIKELRGMTDLLGDTPTVLLSGMRGMLESLGGVTDHLNTAGDGMDHLKDAYTNVQDYSSDILDTTKESMDAFSALSEDLSGLLPYIRQASASVEQAKALLEKLQKALEQPNQMTGEALLERLETAEQDFADLAATADDAAQIAQLVQPLAEALRLQLQQMPELEAEGGALLSQLDDWLAELKDLAEMLRWVNEHKEQLKALLDTLADLSQTIELTEVLEETNQLLTTIEQALQQAEKVDASLVAATSAVSALFGTLTNALSSASSDLNIGIHQVLDGLSGAADSAQGITSSAGQLQQVGDTLQTALDKVLSRYTEQNHLLQMDAAAQKQSFTSEQNGTPSSLQVILRTETIGLTIIKEADPEANQTAQTPWERIKQVFQKIWRAILTLFE